MTEEGIRNYNLNLAPTYVPKWGAWEVAREIVSNAIDADPTGYTIDASHPNRMVVRTTTSPDLAEMLVIGHGSKGVGASTIGQFGEGLKMAALVATRSGGSLRVETESDVVTFSLEDFQGVKTLHANIRPNLDTMEGCKITIDMANVGLSTAGRFYQGPLGPVAYANNHYSRLFVKGVWVRDLSCKNPAIWDWNLDLALNRDRDMVADASLMWDVGAWITVNGTKEMYSEMIQRESSFEALSIEYACFNEDKKKMGKAAFEELYGDSVIASSDQAVNDRARALGRKPVKVNDIIVQRLLHLVPTAEEVVAAMRHDPIDHDFDLSWCERLDDLVDAKHPDKILVFDNDTEQLYGYAKIKPREIWLNKRLFNGDSKSDLYGTYLHELAHLTSCASDGDTAFENALTMFLGRIAKEVI